MAGVDSYRVFLGRTLDAVTRATVGSPEYLGAYTAPACDLQTAPISGQTYYWRVDLLIGGNVVASQVQSFTVSRHGGSERLQHRGDYRTRPRQLSGGGQPDVGHVRGRVDGEFGQSVDFVCGQLRNDSRHASGKTRCLPAAGRA